jgi:hypothetical protein
MKKNFKFTAKVWRYPAQAAWYFVYVDDKTTEVIKKMKNKKKVGFGFIPIEATVGKTIWQTSLFPTKEGEYLIAVKALVRKKEGIFDGDKIGVRFKMK